MTTRQQLAGNGDFGPWQISGTSFNNETVLTGQPCRIQLEYRVNAVNSAGQSVSSNVVSAVL
ncbi:MAG TPA: hypothetical protein VMW23_02155 [Sedimentisphaerales bacterium]|nr:hypothetical protein [Sedimentisphaerales bacterium]